jgi:DNA primase
MQEVNLELLKEKVNLVEFISQRVELEYKNGEWWGLCPFHNEKTPSFSVDEEKQRYFCHGCKAGGSIIDFYSEYYKVNIHKAIAELSESYKVPMSPVPSIIRIAKKYMPRDKSGKVPIVMQFDSDPMEGYTKSPILEWLDEGIDQDVMDLFGVRYDTVQNNIVFPIHDHEGNIISIKARKLSKSLPKYYYYIPFGTVNFLYGYWQNKKQIIEQGEIIIFEGEKSVMKAKSFGYHNGSASMTDRLQNTIENIIKIPCKDVVIAYDKGISKSQIVKEVKTLKKYKNIFIIQDKWDLLNEKDAPVDQGKEVFDFLYQNKERII